MRLARVLFIVVLCAVGVGLLSGCCGRTSMAGCRAPSPCCFDPCRWWEACPTDDCAPIGDPCDCCDSAG